MAVGHIPADAAQTAAQGVAAALILAALALHAVQRAGQSRDGNSLDGQEHTKIDLGAQFFTGGNHIGAPDQERNARAGYVEALAQGEELHRAFLGPRRVEDAAAVGTVKDDIAVCVVMHEQNVVLTAESNDLGVELRRADAAHRVGRQADQHELCLAGNILGDGGNVGQKMVFLRQFIVPRLGTAQAGGVIICLTFFMEDIKKKRKIY